MARSPSPAVFNTGQVLFGWCAMYQERPDASREAAARKAAAWMLEVQDEDGAWRKNLSALVLNPLNTYNSRAAWGLAMAGKVFGEPRWVAAAERNGDWVLGQQNEAGWWANNSMDDGEPFLHAIAYVTEGMLELGVLVGRDDFVECSRRASDAMLEAYELNGRVAGRLGPRWEYASRWRCLTGEAQLALTWLRHFELTGRADYFDAARRLNRDVTRTVALDDLVPEASGGVKGSCPFWGGYHPNGYPNHAVKFLMDSLMLQVRLEPSTAQPPVRSRAVAERPDQSPG